MNRDSSALGLEDVAIEDISVQLRELVTKDECIKVWEKSQLDLF